MAERCVASNTLFLLLKAASCSFKLEIQNLFLFPAMAEAMKALKAMKVLKKSRPSINEGNECHEGSEEDLQAFINGGNEGDEGHEVRDECTAPEGGQGVAAAEAAMPQLRQGAPWHLGAHLPSMLQGTEGLKALKA